MVWQRRILDFLDVRRQRPRCRAFVPALFVFAALICSVECSNPCHAANASSGRGREAFVIERDSAASRRIADIREYIRRKRWPQTAELLIRLSSERGKSLVPFQVGWSISVSRYCNLLAASLPAQGLRVYRAKIDTRAAGWLQDARRTQSDDLLKRIVREAFCSNSGDDALLLLGQRAWDRGDVPTARRYWSLLIRPQHAVEATGRLFSPDSEFDPAGIHARLILCDIVQQEFRRADRSLADFRKRFPKSTGKIAGRNGHGIAVTYRRPGVVGRF